MKKKEVNCVQCAAPNKHFLKNFYLIKMKIHYSHHYGRMSDCDLSFCLVNAYDVLPEEEKYALENGWTLGEEIGKDPLWWQARATRLKVSKFKFNRKTRKMLRPVKGIETTFKR